MNKREIRIAGYGGQGVILSAYILGKAASIFDKKYATMIQSFGPEARGSACSAQLIISDVSIDYPYLRSSDLLVALSQESLHRYYGELKSEGTLIFEEDMVKTNSPQLRGERLFGVPATRIADQLGRRIVMNMVIVGFFTAVTGLLNPEAVQLALKDSIPGGTEDINLKAFDEGWKYGVKSNNNIPLIFES